MAKYTYDDAEIQNLDTYDFVNYNFDLIKFDVDKNQEANAGLKSLQIVGDLSKVGDMFKSPMNFTMGIFALSVGLMTILLIIYCIVMLVLKIIGGPENDLRLEVLFKMFIYFLSALIVLVILYVFISKIVAKTTATYYMAK